MLRILISRALLLALPFVAWFVWRKVAERTGRPMGSTPWAWLVAAGCALVVISLIGGALFQKDNRAQVYVPAQAQPGGAVVPGHFERR